MPRNIDLYPDDFGSAQLGTASNALTIQSAVSSIELQARDTAIRNAYARRIAGQAASENQLQVVKFGNFLMPLNKAGITLTKAPLLGTAAYFGGGRAAVASATISSYIYELRFSNEVLMSLDIRLTLPRSYCGTVSNSESGKFAGGIDANTNFFTAVCEKYVYSKGQIQRVSDVLSSAIAGPAGGMGDATRGIMAGGGTSFTVAIRTGHSYNHATDIITTLANFLPVAKYSAHNGVSSPTSGFVWSGAALANTANVVDTIDRIDYANQTLTATAIATAVTHSHLIHAAGNSSLKGYFSGGSTAVAYATGGDPLGVMDDTTHSLTYSGQTVALLTARLRERIICADGASSSEAFYVVGGDTPTTNWQGSQTIQKTPFSNETTFTIGATLTRKTSDQGGFSDYGPAYSK